MRAVSKDGSADESSRCQEVGIFASEFTFDYRGGLGELTTTEQNVRKAKQKLRSIYNHKISLNISNVLNNT